VEESPLGTGGGLRVAVSLVAQHRPFLLLNGDTFFDVHLDDLTAFHQAHQSQWTFALFPTAERGRYMGMELDEIGRVKALRTAPPATGEFLANGGVYLVDPTVVSTAGQRSGEKASLENELLPALLERGCAIHGMQVAGRFIDIGTPSDYGRAADVLNMENRPSPR